MSTTSSRLDELRKYRFKNGSAAPNSEHNGEAATTNGTADDTSSKMKMATGRKRIRVMSASDSSGDEAGATRHPSKIPNNTQNGSPVKLTIAQREQRLVELKRQFVSVDATVLQDELLRTDWDVAKAVENLKQKKINQTSPTTTTNAAQNGHHVSHASHASHSIAQYTVTQHKQIPKKKKHHRRGGSSSDENDLDGDHRNHAKVFDSDDESDTEQTFFMTKDRKNVLEFLNEASNAELMAVKSCSARKIEILVPLRPFRDWADLIHKLETNKTVTTDLLNACQDFLQQRNNMSMIMKKCQRLVDQLERAVSHRDTLLKQPKNLNPNLKLADYQLVGLNWLAVIHGQKMNGILADEMGLGKTIQVIAFLAHLKETNQARGTHLIVVPSSTLDNWDSELAKWCPDLAVEKYYGNQNERRALRIKWAKTKFKGIDVVLTTYHVVASTPEERKMFRVIQMHYVIFDEAHMLKNMTTQRYAQLVQISAESRLLLTGTPLQNSLLELMSLLCFVMPSMFEKNTDDIKSLFQKTKQIKGEELSAFERKQIEQAKLIMKPFVLRRLKADVLSCLPKKTDITVKVPLTEWQKERYNDLVKCYSSDDGIVQATTEQSGISIMMDMRKLANHPCLMRFHYSDEMVHQVARELSRHPLYKKNRNPQYVFEEIAPLSDFQMLQTIEKYELAQPDIPDRVILESGKFKELDKLLPKLKSEGHRVLIFSQFTMMLDVLERYLDIRDHSYLRFDGQTAVVDRQEIIDKYTSDPNIFIFLLSTKAGGLGINLTSADTVIIHDIDFNPYNDKQAEDRSHRLGQTKPVTIYKFIAEGTIEEGMAMVAKEKLNLEREVTTDTGGDGDGTENVEQEHKCMVRLLTMALGMKDNKRAESMISPAKTMST